MPPELSPDVLTRFASGDEGAFAQVYARYAGPMFSVALRSLGRHDLASDAVQQAFLQAWRAASTLAPDAPVAPWLFTITKRCAIDIWRKEARHDASVLDESAHHVTDSDMDSVWDCWQVRLALTDLSAEERAIIKLAYFDGYSQSQIADRLGLPLGTVKSRSGRAHRRLGELLAHLGPEPIGGSHE